MYECFYVMQILLCVEHTMVHSYVQIKNASLKLGSVTKPKTAQMVLMNRTAMVRIF